MQAPPGSRLWQGTLLSRLHCRLYTHKSTIKSGAMVCQSNRVAWHKARWESLAPVLHWCQTSPQIRKCPLLIFHIFLLWVALPCSVVHWQIDRVPGKIDLEIIKSARVCLSSGGQINRCHDCIVPAVDAMLNHSFNDRMRMVYFVRSRSIMF